MIARQTDMYIKACMQAWLFCESCIHNEVSTQQPRTELIRKCHECAQSCFAVVSRLISDHPEVSDLAFNCIIHCRLCQQECEKFTEAEDILQCAEMCRECAEKMRDIAGNFCLN